jgi:nucleotide-binding universal stress UspA family protein
VRVLVALDTSDIGESAAVAIGAWSRSVPMEVHLLSVVHPKDLHAREESSFSGEFSAAEDTEPAHIPLIASGQYGGVLASTSDPRPMTVEYRGQAIARARSEREDYLRRVVLRHFPDANATVLVEFSEQTAETIVETAKSLGVDAIAMGTHGKSGIRHALVGSVTEQVIRQSPVPVVLIGPGAHAALLP